MKILFFTLVILSAPYVLAGKVDDVQAEVKKSCNKDIPDHEALRMVKRLFLSCVPDSKIEINGCKITCLKRNSGTVVGQ